MVLGANPSPVPMDCCEVCCKVTERTSIPAGVYRIAARSTTIAVISTLFLTWLSTEFSAVSSVVVSVMPVVMPVVMLLVTPIQDQTTKSITLRQAVERLAAELDFVGDDADSVRSLPCGTLRAEFALTLAIGQFQLFSSQRSDDVKRRR
jgi:hypothetical protein